MKKQSGFTLIELAIVLVIIGLLLGGVLKGQELINSARVKNIASDFRNVQVYVYGYQDKYRALPGDDARAQDHVGATAANPPGAADGDGVIDGDWNHTANNTEESCIFWQHVRMANLAPGTTTIDCTSAGSTYVARNAMGGRFGIQSIGPAGNFTTITDAAPPMTGNFVACSAGILGSLAIQVDTMLDDGETSTGSVRAIQDNNPGPSETSAAITAGLLNTNMTVCMAF